VDEDSSVETNHLTEVYTQLEALEAVSAVVSANNICPAIASRLQDARIAVVPAFDI